MLAIVQQSNDLVLGAASNMSLQDFFSSLITCSNEIRDMCPMTVCSYQLMRDVQSVKMFDLEMDFILQALLELLWP